MEVMERVTVLVTGGAGFIGAHVVEELLKKKYRVIVPYINIDSRSTFAQKELEKRVVVVPLDIRDKQKIFDLHKKYQFDYIFHLAAQTLVTEAYKNPRETLDVNIMGTVNMLELVRENNAIKGIIIASSDKAYGKTTEAYTEKSPLKGDHPYDVSKSSADLIAQTYFSTYNTPVVITRFGNVYGEGDLHFDRIVPGICEAIVKKKTLAIRSDGKYVRDYLYVKDVANGYMTLLKYIDTIHGEAYNFSSIDTLSVVDLIKKAEKILNRKINYRILNTAKNEIPYQHLNDAKIKKLGWKPRYDLDSTLKSIVQWYKLVS